VRTLRATFVPLALAVCLACTGGARADDPAPNAPLAPTALPDGLDMPAWRESDLDGKWLMYERLAPRQPGPTSAPWVPFLAQEREWDLIEWIGLASNSSVALEALRVAKHPAWTRLAVWQHEAPDSHRFQSAVESLKQHHGAVRAWLELHRVPADRPIRAAQLETARPSGADVAAARAAAPPYDLERLLGPLRPPADVAEMRGLRAEPGRMYLHQVRRALAVLRHGGLFGEPWRARHAALLAHPNADVRREAAHAMAARPPTEAAPEALFARLSATDERPDVRSAVVDALARLPEPTVRLRVMAIALDPSSPGFQAAVSALADLDDGYLAQAWGSIALEVKDAGLGRWLLSERRRADERIGARSAGDWARAVRLMLELAAAEEGQRRSLAPPLGAWTRRELSGRRQVPEVGAALREAATKDGAVSPGARALAAEILGGG
jgi:hypothetical protein